MRRIIRLALTAAAIAAAVSLVSSCRRSRRSPEPVVEEWGKESFPASDPPQNW